ncbi:MAG TPA: thiamine phosphate synthase [Alphaproteobacteria bacterium]|nr:thiamine phosphate synthase [Alphaproteobacteria bacterium]
MATDEAALLTRTRRAERLRGIYVIVNEDARAVEIGRAALEGGVKVLQYRAKGGVNIGHLQLLRQHTLAHGALLIVNDDWRAALKFACDGVHLGPDDDGFTVVAPVREALGDRLIGLSCGTADEVRYANAQDVDYVGIGPVYATVSKDDAGPPLGLEELRAIAAESWSPVAAIGGIGLERIDAVRATGVSMAAVISAVSSAADPRATARALVEAWHAGGA